MRIPAVSRCRSPRWLVAGAFTALTLVTPAGAGDQVAIRVNPQMSYAPANLFVRTTVTPDKANRRLEVVAESPEFLRASEVQLEGDSAPRVSFFQFHGLPAGEYAVRATVLDARGSEIARSEVKATVIAGAER